MRSSPAGSASSPSSEGPRTAASASTEGGPSPHPARNPRAAPLRTLVGFDGFLDRIVRVVEEDRGPEGRSHFPSLAAFSAHLAAKGGKSCTLELEGGAARPGGNAPLMAAALAALGAESLCLGALGSGRPRPEFAPLEELGCELLGLAEPGLTTALEFDDGKIMLTEFESLDGLDWVRLKELLGRKRLRALAAGRKVVGLVNWSEMRAATGLWRGFLEEVLGALPPDKGRLLLFDLADCSRRPAAELRELLELAEAATAGSTTLLSLNENETRLVGSALGLDRDAPLEELGEAIFGRLALDLGVVHSREAAYAWSAGAAARAPSLRVERPRQSTGVGDHFNGALAFALAGGLGPAAAGPAAPPERGEEGSGPRGAGATPGCPGGSGRLGAEELREASGLREALDFACAAAAAYLRKGSSPSLEEALREAGRAAAEGGA